MAEKRPVLSDVPPQTDEWQRIVTILETSKDPKERGEAWVEILRRFIGPIEQKLARRGYPEADAADICSQLCECILKSIDSGCLDLNYGEDAVRSWINQRFKYVIADYYRWLRRGAVENINMMLDDKNLSYDEEYIDRIVTDEIENKLLIILNEYKEKENVKWSILTAKTEHGWDDNQLAKHLNDQGDLSPLGLPWNAGNIAKTRSRIIRDIRERFREYTEE